MTHPVPEPSKPAPRAQRSPKAPGERLVAPAEPEARSSFAAAALEEGETDRSEVQARMDPPAPVAVVSGEDVAAVVRCLALIPALIRVRRGSPQPDLERIKYRAQKVAHVIAARLPPGAATATFWLGLVGDMASEFIEDAIKAPRPQPASAAAPVAS